jgi:hypothetical protein
LGGFDFSAQRLSYDKIWADFTQLFKRFVTVSSAEDIGSIVMNLRLLSIMPSSNATRR